MQRLVVNYLSDIVDIALHAKLLHLHRHHHHTSLPPSIDINDMTVDVVYLNTVDPLSRPSYTSLSKIISMYIDDVDESEHWVTVLKERRVSAAIHPEAAIMCMKRAYCQSGGEFAEQFDSRSADVSPLPSPSPSLLLTRHSSYPASSTCRTLARVGRCVIAALLSRRGRSRRPDYAWRRWIHRGVMGALSLGYRRGGG